MTRLPPGELRTALEPMWALRDDPRQIDRLVYALLDRPRLREPVADEAVELVRRFPEGLSGSDIAFRIHRSKSRVLAAPPLDPRLVQVGTGRGSRFRLAVEGGGRAPEPQGTGQERAGRDAGGISTGRSLDQPDSPGSLPARSAR